MILVDNTTLIPETGINKYFLRFTFTRTLHWKRVVCGIVIFIRLYLNDRQIAN